MNGKIEQVGCSKPSTFPLPYQKMPNKNKSRNTSRNNSRKSTASSQGKPAVVDDDDWGSGLIIKTQTSRKTTPVNTKPKTPPSSPRPDFLEPLSPKPLTPPPPPPTPWETLGIEETEYHAMMERVRKQQMEDMRKTYMDNLLADLLRPSYWLRRIEMLEREREYFNKKRGWSAADMLAVDRIDEEIAECQDELDHLYAEEDRLEVECD